MIGLQENFETDLGWKKINDYFEFPWDPDPLFLQIP
jgi:hypothetical protein